MCRGFQPIDQTQRLFKLKSFHLILTLSKPLKSLPESITLHYLPRITGGPLEINGSGIRPDAAAFVTLHRVVVGGGGGGGGGGGKSSSGEGQVVVVVYGSRERVRVSEGVRFEVYVRDERVVVGVFRRGGGGWRVECRGGGGGGGVVREAEVVVGAEEGGVEMREVVAVVKRKRRWLEHRGLKEIPEQESEGEEVEVEVCCCCECGGDGAEDGGGDGGDGAEEGGCEVEVEVEVEGVRWAVDVGIWVVCLGVGYLVSKASSKSVRRRRRLL